jgi:hypothetical protein
VTDQTRPSASPADPVRVLENTRRTLLQLVANIDAVLAAVKEPAGNR